MKLSLFALLVSLLAGCTSSPTPTGCDGITIDPQKEIVIVEPSVIQGPRARNAGTGALSFRHVVEGQQDGFVASLFSSYAEVAPSRAAALESQVVAEWRAAGFDPAASPLRLIAVANRLDLAGELDDLGGAGEARLVFAMTDGPADDPDSAELPMTVIFEYALGGDHRAWTADFHALSRYETFSDDYVTALEALVARFTTLSQVRIDDGGQVFAELALGADGLLAPRGVRNTPEQTIDPALLASLVTQNADAIIADRWLLPEELRAKVTYGDATWPLPGVSDPARTAFAAGTCSGCHGQVASANSGFHISPGAVGTARLSTFLLDPANPDGDELTRRAKLISTTLCAP